jgi:hypothetical protein
MCLCLQDHFNYLLDRIVSGKLPKYDKSSLVDLVDAAIANGDRQTAEVFCTIDAGHGTVSNKWEIDCAIQPWKEGTSLWQNNVSVVGSSMDDCWIVWDDRIWDIFECSVPSLNQLKEILGCSQ